MADLIHDPAFPFPITKAEYDMLMTTDHLVSDIVALWYSRGYTERDGLAYDPNGNVFEAVPPYPPPDPDTSN